MESSNLNKDPTASILIIGNEILSGKVEDSNSKFLSRELRKLGVNVQRIAVIPDLEEEISLEIKRTSKQYTWVFTCGGVGPTHDDVTLRGIAQGLSKKVSIHPEILKMLHEHYGSTLNEAQLKLSEVPEGAELIMTGTMSFPVLKINNIFIFPGVPEIMKKKFNSIKMRFQTSPYALKQLYVNASEDEIAHLLNRFVEKFPDLLLGSYPQLNQKNYKVILTVETKNESLLESAFQYLLQLIPSKLIYKTE